MWLVICEPEDISALWAYRSLQQLGLAPLELVSASALMYSLYWNHQLTNASTHIEFALADGRRFDSGSIRGVLNRLTSLPAEHLRSATPQDQDYAIQEIYAFFVSWLYGLPVPVLNRPTPQNINGTWKHASEWALLAAKAGLPSIAYQQTMDSNLALVAERLVPFSFPTITVFVVGNQVIGKGLSAEIASGCLRLAKLAGFDLLAIEFVRSSLGGWSFAGVSSQPDLRLGGLPLIEALYTLSMKANEFAGGMR